MASGYNNWEQFYQRFNLIFNGLVAVPLLPFGYIFLETQKETPDPALIFGTSGKILMVALLVVVVISIVFSQMYKRSIPEKVKVVSGIKQKLETYLYEKTRQYLILEAASVSAIIGLYMTKDQLFSVAYVVVLFIYSLSRPTFDSVVRETGIPEKDLIDWGGGEK